MNSIGDSFAWAFRDPAWPSKLLLQGLILIIPVVGWIAMNGWLLMAYDNVRAGRPELPPAGFHLSRGISLFFVFLVYGVVLGIPSGVLYAIGVVVASNAGNAQSTITPVFFSIAALVSIAVGLLLRFLYPALIVTTARGGFGGGMNVQQVWRLSTMNVTNTIVAAVIILVASIIGGFGFFCCIGFIFTIPYENSITAAAAAWYDQQPQPVAAT